METATKVVEWFQMVGFNMWQLLIFFLVLIFKEDIRKLLKGKIDLDVAGNKVSFSPSVEAVKEISEINNKKDLTPDQYKKSIGKVIDDSVLKSIRRIKYEIPLFDQKILNSISKNNKDQDCYISMGRHKYNLILDDINFLEKTGCLRTNVTLRVIHGISQHIHLHLMDFSDDFIKLLKKSTGKEM